MNRLGTRLAGAALIASAVAVVTATGTASAMFHTGPDFTSGDARATVHTSRGFSLSCRDAGLAGDRIDVTGFTDDDRARLTITAVPAGRTLTGVVVQGVFAYNVYPGAGLGALPLKNLRAPVRNGGRALLVVHWFGCGTTTASPAMVPPATGPAEPTSAATATGRPDPSPGASSGGSPGTSARTDGGGSASAGGDGDQPDQDTSAGGAGAPLGPAAPPATAPAPATASSGAARPDVLAAATPPANTMLRLRNAARVDFGVSLYLALTMLLVVTGALLLVAPRQLSVGVDRLRHRHRA